MAKLFPNDYDREGVCSGQAMVLSIRMYNPMRELTSSKMKIGGTKRSDIK